MSKLPPWCGLKIVYVKAKMDQGVGKLRRFALARMREEYVARMQQKRLGQCRRCGLCCRLLFECPFLRTLTDGTCRCCIYGLHPNNCRLFPIDERDLRERDSLDARVPCGYRFKDR
jgi:hypothetical protein